jgi:hypothetical protein
MTRRRRPLLTALVLVSLAAPARSAPTGTAFTYQGRLLENGTPPTGLYDLQFTLYDVPAGGSALLPPLVVDDVAVASGLFTVSLDFGAAAFPGEARFMEIGVRPGASGGTFTTLSGRQELRPTPNALAVPWPGVNNKPAGFADDVDDDLLATLGCSAGQVAKWNGSAWTCSADADSGGDITDVTAGSGLSGGGSSGAVSLQANFAGSGSAASVAHSDHDHFAQAWSGSAGNGLLVQNSNPTNGSAALRGETTAASGSTYGILGASASTAGIGVYGAGSNYGVQGSASATAGYAYGVTGIILSDQGAALAGYSNGTAGYGYGVIGVTYATAGIGVFGANQSAGGAGVSGYSPSPAGVGTYGSNVATTGSAYGVIGQSNSTAGYAVYGVATSTTGSGTGMRGVSFSPSGRGVVGEAQETSGSNFGVYGSTTSSSGRGVYGQATATTGVAWGVQGITASSIGRGVYGAASATTGQVVGVQGFINSDNGVAISGFANQLVGQARGAEASSNAASGIGVYGAAQGTGTTYGTFGFAQSPTGYGLYGWNQSLTGTTYGVFGLAYSTGGTALYGFATATSGLNYGVYGRTQSPAGYAGYFQGNAHVNGTLSKLGGAFKIDHPLDPENKYLLHSFVESPDMKNVYDGVVTTNDAGYATVELPPWFEALNRDFRYQLTVIEEGDAFVLAKVARKIEDNRFVVRTSKPGIEVSWQVTGIRKDPYAERHRIPVEQEKTAAERGRYLAPDAYGLPAERAVGFDSEREQAQSKPPLPLRLDPADAPEESP